MQTVHLARVAVAGKGETDYWVQILVQEVFVVIKYRSPYGGFANSI